MVIGKSGWVRMGKFDDHGKGGRKRKLWDLSYLCFEMKVVKLEVKLMLLD